MITFEPFEVVEEDRGNWPDMEHRVVINFFGLPVYTTPWSQEIYNVYESFKEDLTVAAKEQLARRIAHLLELDSIIETDPRWGSIRIK